LGQAEIHPVHSLDMIDGASEQSFLDRKPDTQVFHIQQWRGGFDRYRTSAGLGAEQFPSIRMLWGTKQSFAGCLFDDATALHDTYAMSDAPYQIQVMADQQQCHAQALLQLL